MGETKRYESFPGWIILTCNLLSFAIYAIGASVLSGLGWWVVGLYLAGCLWLEIRVMQKSCVHCYYYGKNCGVGKGKLCALIFKQGDPTAFACKQATWLDILPDFLVSLVPLIAGIVLSILAFSWLRVILLIALVLLAFGGTAAVRGNLLCKHCKQREIGCPAAKLFEKAQS